MIEIINNYHVDYYIRNKIIDCYIQSKEIEQQLSEEKEENEIEEYTEYMEQMELKQYELLNDKIKERNKGFFNNSIKINNIHNNFHNIKKVNRGIQYMKLLPKRK